MALSEKEEYIAQCMSEQGKTREECEQMWNQAHKAPGDQEGKTAYIEQCVAGGKSREECEAAWNEAHGASGDYATLVRTNELQAVKIDQLTKMLKEATDILKSVNAERDAVTEARKYELAVELERDSDGRMKHDALMKKDLNELTIMKTAIDTAKPKGFVSVAKMFSDTRREADQKLTVGEYDPEKKRYKGGI